MKCTIIDPKGCFACPYPDCIADEADIKVQDKFEAKKNGKRKHSSIAVRADKGRKHKPEA